MMSLVMLNYKRPEMATRVLDRVLDMEQIKQAVVWNNNSEVPFKHPHPKVCVMNPSKDIGMNSRWHAAALATQDAVLSLDDDLAITPQHVEVLFNGWLENPEIGHGFWGRNPTLQTNAYAVHIDGKDAPVEILGTGTLVYHRKYATRLLDHIRQHNLTHDTFKNQGEDIYLSYLMMASSGLRNQCHYAQGLPSLNRADRVALSRRKSHKGERTRVMRTCRKHFLGEG